MTQRRKPKSQADERQKANNLFFFVLLSCSFLLLERCILAQTQLDNNSDAMVGARYALPLPLWWSEFILWKSLEPSPQLSSHGTLVAVGWVNPKSSSAIQNLKSIDPLVSPSAQVDIVAVSRQQIAQLGSAESQPLIDKNNKTGRRAESQTKQLAIQNEVKPSTPEAVAVANEEAGSGLYGDLQVTADQLIIRETTQAPGNSAKSSKSLKPSRDGSLSAESKGVTNLSRIQPLVKHQQIIAATPNLMTNDLSSLGKSRSLSITASAFVPKSHLDNLFNATADTTQLRAEAETFSVTQEATSAVIATKSTVDEPISNNLLTYTVGTENLFNLIPTSRKSTFPEGSLAAASPLSNIQQQTSADHVLVSAEHQTNDLFSHSVTAEEPLDLKIAPAQPKTQNSAKVNLVPQELDNTENLKLATSVLLENSEQHSAETADENNLKTAPQLLDLVLFPHSSLTSAEASSLQRLDNIAASQALQILTEEDIQNLRRDASPLYKSQDSLLVAQASLPVPLPNADDLDDSLPQQRDLQPPPPSQFPTPQTPEPLPPPLQLGPQTPTPPAEVEPPSETTPTPDESPSGVPGTITVERFEFEGNTAFSDQELAALLKNFTGRPITFSDLLEARSAVTQLYLREGYDTSGAFIPVQELTGRVIKIQVLEGRLEEIRIIGNRRLKPGYIRSRIAVRTKPPLNTPRLLDSLRLLQLDPLIDNLSAELSAGSQPGTNLLTVRVKEASTFSADFVSNNGRSPSVGSFRRGFTLTQANFLGIADSLTFSYTNTDGSNAADASYTIPINPRNGTISLSYGNTSSVVIEQPFDILDIESSSRYLDITYRQPVVQTPSQEFTLGLTASRRESDTSLLGMPFELSAGADSEGRTRVSALRFFQEWTKRSNQQVVSARSQFSFGIGAFNATLNGDLNGTPQPDSRFISWRGQAQLVRLLAPDTLFLVRGDVQLADRELLPIEQFGLGGQESVRGYRQDALLADNGALLTLELRYPILRIPKWQGVLQLIPFLDLGAVWNTGREDPSPNHLTSVGLGLQYQQGDSLTIRLDYGIPLVDVKSSERTWQENGLYFSIRYSPF